MTKQKGQPIGEPFAPVLDRLLYGNKAFLQLPSLAKLLLIYLIAEAPRPYAGEEIRMGSRYAEKLLGRHFTNCADAMRAVDESGLATITDKGRGIKRGNILRASRWELTFWKERHRSENATKSRSENTTKGRRRLSENTTKDL